MKEKEELNGFELCDAMEEKFININPIVSSQLDNDFCVIDLGSLSHKV